MDSFAKILGLVIASGWAICFVMMIIGSVKDDSRLFRFGFWVGLALGIVALSGCILRYC